ncbi:MAG: 4Fe-4S dicluster domain-containing protein [Thermoanaerobaculia bacterium]|nr:4Fe-4S dicluster domain-containing protein [Thermoanaerobaculia bacterium]
MATVRIEEPGCRGCTLCADLCPVAVFALREGDGIATVVHAERCIGCLSCAYACPSGCIEVGDYLQLRPFHRIEGHAALMRRFLQEQPLADALTPADLEEAWSDVAARLRALAGTVTETIGSGYRAIGRRAGAMAAAHLPEMYEEAGLEQVLGGLRERFSYGFDFHLEGEAAVLDFRPCSLCKVVQSTGETVGQALLCHLFHEYWAGLLSAFVGTKYRYEVPVAGESCRMELRPA